MTAEARADYTALLWEQQEARRQQASDAAEWPLVAALIPHTFLHTKRGCGSCGLPFGAAIHHWDDNNAAEVAA